MRTEDNRCVKEKNKGLELVGDKIQLKMDNTVCALVWGVWFSWVVDGTSDKRPPQ